MEYRLCQERFEALKLISPTTRKLLPTCVYHNNCYWQKQVIVYCIQKPVFADDNVYAAAQHAICTNRESVFATNLTKWNTFGIMGVFVWIISLMREPLAFSSLYIFDIALVTCGGTSSLYGDLNASISSSRWSQLTA